jgi:hypothetical protein
LLAVLHVAHQRLLYLLRVSTCRGQELMEPVLTDPEEETRTEESETIESMSELESNASNSSEPGDDFETASDSSSKIAAGSRWVYRMLG